MTITLNHMIVPVSDKEAASAFFADLVGLPKAEIDGPFVPVRVNAHLTLDFDDRRDPAPGHFAFLVDDATFDHVLKQVASVGAPFGSGPENGWDGQINHLAGGRGMYVRDPDGHSYEFFTRDPAGRYEPAGMEQHENTARDAAARTF